MTDKMLQRLNNIETSFGLLQHDFEARNETILWLTSRVLELEKSVRQMTGQLDKLESASELGDLPDETPPHY